MNNTHSKYFSPSSIGRRLLCRGSAFLEAGMPDVSNPYAEEGTLLHSYMQEHNLGKPVVIAQGNNRAELISGAIEDTKTIEATLINPVKSVEQRVSLEYLGYPEVFGTADLVLDVMFDTLLVLDYKFGQVEVSPDAPQFKTYGLAAAGEMINSYERIILAISQPKCGGLSVHATTPDELLSWFKTDLEPCIKDILNGVKTLTPTDAGCLYCKGKEVCAAYTQSALTTAQRDFGGEPNSSLVTTINDTLVAEYYPRLPLLEGWIAQVKSHAMDMAQRGALPGYKLVAGRGSRSWTDEAAAEELLDNLGVDPFERKLLSPAKAEKLGKEVKDAIQPLVAKTPGNPTIAPATDKRRTLPMAAEDFNQVS